MRRNVLLLECVLAAVLHEWSLVQATAVAQQKPLAFEAASIKRNRSGDDFTEGGFQPGGRINARNVTLVNLMIAAYATGKVDGGPAWSKTDRFDVVAVGNRNASVAQTREMMRTLLADRFKLVTRTEMRQEPIFDLSVISQSGQLGPQLKPASPECSTDTTARENRPPSGPPDLNRSACGLIAFGGAVFRGRGVRVDQIANTLGGQVNRSVRDRTALEGSISNCGGRGRARTPTPVALLRFSPHYASNWGCSFVPPRAPFHTW